MTHEQSQARLNATWFKCSNCGRSHPEHGWHHSCPKCQAPFTLREELKYQPDPSYGSGLLRYRKSFPLPEEAPIITLGEGDTPLLPVRVRGRALFFKCEQQNPTGSFKDRGSAVLASVLRAQGIHMAVEDSSGNAGASFAAYAARAGIKARIFVPDYASGPKRRQIEAYGAEVVRILGPRSNATEAALRAVAQGAIYASHAYLPHGQAGMASAAFEIYEQLGASPGSVVVPVGQGSLLLGMQLGFRALKQAGQIHQLPRLVAVQARACAPIWAVHSMGASGLTWMREGQTMAEGIRILRPLRGDRVLKAVEQSQGTVLAVEEPEIVAGRNELGRRGLYVEPTSAVVWPALLAAWEQLVDPVVVLLTGSGLKSA